MQDPKRIDRTTHIMINYRKLLTEHKLWPLCGNWQSFPIRHGHPADAAQRKQTLDLIRLKVGTKSGLYLYYLGDKCIYVGKAKVLFDRLKSHHRESFEPVPGDTADRKWHRFFSQIEYRSAPLTAYWAEVAEEADRHIFEICLRETLRPTFDD